MKLCILLGYKFLIKNLNFGVNQYISGHVISQNVEFIRLAHSTRVPPFNSKFNNIYYSAKLKLSFFNFFPQLNILQSQAPPD